MVFGSREDFKARSPPVHDSSGIVKTRDFGYFWPFLWAIAHGFGVRRGFKWPGTPSQDFH